VDSTHNQFCSKEMVEIVAYIKINFATHNFVTKQYVTVATDFHQIRWNEMIVRGFRNLNQTYTTKYLVFTFYSWFEIETFSMTCWHIKLFPTLFLVKSWLSLMIKHCVLPTMSWILQRTWESAKLAASLDHLGRSISTIFLQSGLNNFNINLTWNNLWAWHRDTCL